MSDLNKCQLQLMSAAIFEIRELLSHILGSGTSTHDDAVRLAAHLSYALHNEALAVLEGKPMFDIESAREKVSIAQNIVSSNFSDEFNILLKK